MSLRTVTTRSGDGTPLNIVLQTRQEISFSNASVVLEAINDDGISIKAVVTLANGQQKQLTLWTSVYYFPLSHFTNDEIDARIVEVLEIEFT